MKKSLYIIFLFTILFLGKQETVLGASVSDSYNVPVVCGRACNLPKGGGPGLEVFGMRGEILTNVHKNVDFVTELGSNTSQVFNLPINKKVTLSVGPTTADWLFTGSHYDSPPADGAMYLYSSDAYFGASVPQDTGAITVVSQNPSIVNCTNTGCTANTTGTTNVVVSFVGNSQGFGIIKHRSDHAAPHGSSVNSTDSTDAYYSFPSITYTVTVTSGEETGVSACTGVTGISTTGATVNWSYGGGVNNPQTNYQVDIATDSSFNNVVKTVVASNNTDVSGVRSVPVTGLLSGTNYYSRVRTYDSSNTPSAYSSCAGGFTTIQDANSKFSVSCVADPVFSTGTDVVFKAIAMNVKGIVSYLWKGGSTAETYTKVGGYPTFGGHPDSALFEGQITVTGKDGETNEYSTANCSVNIVDPNALPAVVDSGDKLICDAIDGIEMASGTQQTFFKSRIAQHCESATIQCVKGHLVGDTSSFRYRSCAETKPSEF
ncbi:MAG: fibronectin type III domain-containing protein [bacterium]